MEIEATSILVPIFVANQKTTTKWYIIPQRNEYFTILLNFDTEFNVMINGTSPNQDKKPKGISCWEIPTITADSVIRK